MNGEAGIGKRPASHAGSGAPRRRFPAGKIEFPAGILEIPAGRAAGEGPRGGSPAGKRPFGGSSAVGERSDPCGTSWKRAKSRFASTWRTGKSRISRGKNRNPRGKTGVSRVACVRRSGNVPLSAGEIRRRAARDRRGWSARAAGGSGPPRGSPAVRRRGGGRPARGESG
jgi:hypothetical protein